MSNMARVNYTKSTLLCLLEKQILKAMGKEDWEVDAMLVLALCVRQSEQVGCYLK